MRRVEEREEKKMRRRGGKEEEEERRREGEMERRRRRGDEERKKGVWTVEELMIRRTECPTETCLTNGDILKLYRSREGGEEWKKELQRTLRRRR